AQRRLKAGIIFDTLGRTAGLDPPEPDPGPLLPVTGWRTTVRAVVDDQGGAGFRRHHAHSTVAVGDHGCLVAHPLVDEVLTEGCFPHPVAEVTVRAGVATGERLVLADPSAGDSEVPAGVALVGRDELAAGRRSGVHEEAGGRRWR